MLNLVQNADGSMGFRDEGLAYDIAKVGGAKAPLPGAPSFRLPFGLQMAVAGPTDTAGALGALANPFGVPFYITKSVLVVLTQSSAACTVSAGIAANATTLNAGLISGQTVAAVGMFGGGLVANWQIWAANQFLTASTASGASAGLVGRLIVEGYIA